MSAPDDDATTDADAIYEPPPWGGPGVFYSPVLHPRQTNTRGPGIFFVMVGVMFAPLVIFGIPFPFNLILVGGAALAVIVLIARSRASGRFVSGARRPSAVAGHTAPRARDPEV